MFASFSYVSYSYQNHPDIINIIFYTYQNHPDIIKREIEKLNKLNSSLFISYSYQNRSHIINKKKEELNKYIDIDKAQTRTLPIRKH